MKYCIISFRKEQLDIMKNYDKILEIAKKNQGFIKTSDLKKENINRIYLTRMVRDGLIARLSRGYYGLPNYIEDEYFKIISKSKNSIFSMTTALYLHDLSDRTPLIYDISVPSFYGGSLGGKDNIQLYYESKDIFTMGVIEMKSPFNSTIRVYDMERTICDIIKNKEKIDVEIFSTALKKYVSRKDKKLIKLSEYAKKLKVEKKVSEYLEVLL